LINSCLLRSNVTR